MKVEKGDATLGDWDKASYAEKETFASFFVEGYCGKRDRACEKNIMVFLDSQVSDMKKRMPDHAGPILEGSKLDTNARTGARLMGFPLKKQQD